MKAYKGFDKNLCCDPTGNDPYQYEVGKTYETDTAVVCESGFHACENPLDVFSYYAPGESRYCEVNLEDVSRSENQQDSKVAGKKIKIGLEIGIKGIIQGAIQFIFKSVNELKSSSHSATSGDGSHSATTGNCSPSATSGDRSHSATSGYRSHSATSGDGSHSATSGDGSHSATSGSCSHSATTGYGSHSATTGYCSHSATSGDGSHSATTGYGSHSEVHGKESIAAALGANSRVKGEIGSWLVCAEWETLDEKPHIVGIKTAAVDGENILSGVWYTVKNGEFVKIED